MSVTKESVEPESAKDGTSRFDAFASYSTAPDYALVRKTEAFLESFHTTAAARKLKLRALRICVDGNDFSLAQRRQRNADQTIPDHLTEIVHAHLTRSDHLIVFCSGGAVASSWVDKEVGWWLEHREAETILLVVTEGAAPANDPESVFPQRVREAGVHQKPWYDFRGYCGRAAKNWTKVRPADGERIQLAAHLLGDTAGRVYPVWARIRDRRRRMARVAGTVAAALAAGGLAWWGWTFTDVYQLDKMASDPPITQLTLDGKLLSRLAICRKLDEARLAVRERVQPKMRFDAFHAIGEELLKQGLRKEAREVYQEALELSWERNGLVTGESLANAVLSGVDENLIRKRIEQILGGGSTVSSGDLSVAAKRIAEGGQTQRALEIAEKIPDASQQGVRLTEIGKLQTDPLQAKQIFNRALVLLMKSNTLKWNSNQLKELARAYAAIGDLDGALSAAEGVSHEQEEPYASIADSFARRGDWSSVRRIVALILPVEARAKACRFEIERLAREAKVEEALQFTMEIIPEETKRGRYLLELATKLEESGALEDAVPREVRLRFYEVAKGMVDIAKADVQTLEHLARGRILANDNAGARQLLARASVLLIQKRDWPSAIAIAKLQQRADASQAEFAWVANIRDTSIRGAIPKAVAEAKGCDPDGKPSQELIETLEDQRERDKLYEQWFRQRVAAGDIIAAISASRYIPDVHQRTALMLEEVKELLKKNKVREAVALAEAILLTKKEGVEQTFDEARYRALAETSPALAEMNSVDEAIAAARTIKPKHLRAQALGGIAARAPAAQAAVRGALLTEALEQLALTDHTQRTNTQRTKVLREIVSGFCRNGHVPLATRTMEAIIGEKESAPSRVEIAIALAQKGSFREARLAALQIKDWPERSRAFSGILEHYYSTRK